MLEDMHDVPMLGRAGRRSSSWLLGFARRLPVLHPSTRRCRRSSPRSIEPLYQFLLNKWYFDELYDCIFVRPAMWLGRFLWKKGDGWRHRRLRSDGVAARVLDVTRRVVRLQTGYLYHYAFAMLIGVAALSPGSCSRGAH